MAKKDDEIKKLRREVEILKSQLKSDVIKDRKIKLEPNLKSQNQPKIHPKEQIDLSNYIKKDLRKTLNLAENCAS